MYLKKNKYKTPTRPSNSTLDGLDRPQRPCLDGGTIGRWQNLEEATGSHGTDLSYKEIRRCHVQSLAGLLSEFKASLG